MFHEVGGFVSVFISDCLGGFLDRLVLVCDDLLLHVERVLLWLLD